jgi:hypothetical protein
MLRSRDVYKFKLSTLCGQQDRNENLLSGVLSYGIAQSPFKVIPI